MVHIIVLTLPDVITMYTLFQKSASNLFYHKMSQIFVYNICLEIPTRISFDLYILIFQILADITNK